MITKEKLEVFEYFNGDVDGWARSISISQKSSMTDGDWNIISNLIQDIHLIKNGLTSKQFSVKIEGKINSVCINQETVDFLYKIAGPVPPNDPQNEF